MRNMLIDDFNKELQKTLSDCELGKIGESQAIERVSDMVEDLAARHHSRIEAGKYVIAKLHEMQGKAVKIIADAILRQVERQELLG